MAVSFVETIQSQPYFVFLCFSLGTLSMLRFSLFILQTLYIYFLRPAKNLRRYGKWAIVTGATDGIGKAMALELARQDLDLVLLGRNADKLSQVCRELKAQVPGLKLKTVVMDFSHDLSHGISQLEEAVKDIDVGILVNNAGVTQTTAMYLHEIGEETWRNIVSVNLVAPTVVTAAVLPGMFRRKSGAIINVGSAASDFLPSYPLYSVYAASKRFVSHLSRSLHREYEQNGIHVQCQIPCYVATKMIPRTKASFFVASASQYAYSALRFIGYESRCIPYWTHAIQYYIFQLGPLESLLNRRRYYLATKSRSRRIKHGMVQ